MSSTDAVKTAPPARRAAPIATLASEAPRIGLVVLGLVGLTWFYSSDPFVLNIIAYTFLFAGLATSWNIIGGYGGQFSLGHGVFFAIGAYVTANLYLRLGLSPWIGLVPSAALSAAVAVAVSWPTFRLRGPFFAIATMALNEVVFVLANYFEAVTGGPRGMSIPLKASFANMIFFDRFSYALLMLGFLVACLLVSAALVRSRLGYYLQAVRDDEDAARSAGIDVLSVKLKGMAVSAALTGIGGALFMMYLRFVDPPTVLSLSEVGVKFALITLIGGIGTIYGPLAGALLIVPLESQLRAALGGLVPGAHLIALGVILILAALFLKRGVIGAADALLRRLRDGVGR